MLYLVYKIETTMKHYEIATILELIEGAEFERGEALKHENRNSKGYPYLAGYQTATLRRIKEILACAQ